MSRGIVTPVDDIDFFILTRDYPSSVFTVSATATSTQTSATLTNTGPGEILWLSVASVAATATVRWSVLGVDPVSGNTTVVASLSVDGVSTTNVKVTSVLYIDPRNSTAPQAPSGGAAAAAVQIAMPRTYKVQASITATASGGSPAVSLYVGATRLGGL